MSVAIDRKVTIQAPAATSNCGPGFDTLGIALSLPNFVEVRLTGGLGISAPESLSFSTMAMVEEAASAFAAAAEIPPPSFEFSLWGQIPSARGLSSSATIRCGVVAALNTLHDTPLSQHEMIALCSALDKAPDGVAACFQGGFCVSRIHPETGAYQGSFRFTIPERVAFVVVSPSNEVLTEVQRRALPGDLPFDDAVNTLNSLANVVACFATGEYERLHGSVSDYLHQPYRERLCPFTREAISAGVDGGAWAGWLSGSGSSVVCIAPADAASQVGQNMLSVFRNNGAEAKLFKLKADNQGLHPV